MNDEEIRKIIDSPREYDDSREESYISWARFWFRSCQRWAVILVFVHFSFFLGLAIISGVLFFVSDQTQEHIMYASFFVCCILIAYMIKIFAWVMTSRNSITREIKRLELRIAELAEAVTQK